MDLRVECMSLLLWGQQIAVLLKKDVCFQDEWALPFSGPNGGDCGESPPAPFCLRLLIKQLPELCSNNFDRSIIRFKMSFVIVWIVSLVRISGNHQGWGRRKVNTAALWCPPPTELRPLPLPCCLPTHPPPPDLPINALSWQALAQLLPWEYWATQQVLTVQTTCPIRSWILCN